MKEKFTKIVATIGPVSMEVEMLKEMMRAGMNVARLNFSHSDHDWHRQAIENIRQASQETNIPIAILADLQGPRIRTKVGEEFEIIPGETVILGEEASDGGNDKYIQIDQPNIVDQLKPGQKVLIEDGKMSVDVVNVDGKTAMAKVVDGGIIKNHKGMNFPGANLRLEVLTDKDKSDLEFSLDQNVEYIALSFVGKGADIQSLRALMKDLAPQREWYPKVVAKIERQEAIENLDEIIEEIDVVMVARGDLGIEMRESRVVVLQKEIIAKCLLAVKPVIVATQMLESMMKSPRPTRAEVSDVTNAVIDHADATMLSGETAGGEYPLECVQTMAEIVTNTEESPFDDVKDILEMNMKTKYANMVQGVYQFAKSNNVKAILATSSTGYTARLLSHFRPQREIFIATEDPITHKQLALVWGVDPFLFEGDGDEERLLGLLVDKAKKDGMLENGDEVVTVTNTIVRLQKVK